MGTFWLHFESQFAAIVVKRVSHSVFLHGEDVVTFQFRKCFVLSQNKAIPAVECPEIFSTVTSCSSVSRQGWIKEKDLLGIFHVNIVGLVR